MDLRALGVVRRATGCQQDDGRDQPQEPPHSLRIRQRRPNGIASAIPGSVRRIEVIGDPGNEDYWREQVRLDAWMDAGCPDVEDWLAGRTSSARPSRKQANSLPPSELVHLHALTKAQAGALLGGMSEDWIEKHVLPHVKIVQASRSVVIPADELKRWVDQSSSRAL